jgi:hypothetical protein
MRISLAKHDADHFDADGRCQCGRSCCVHPVDGACVCRGCVCQQTPKTSPDHGLSFPYTGAYQNSGSDYRYSLTPP